MKTAKRLLGLCVLAVLALMSCFTASAAPADHFIDDEKLVSKETRAEVGAQLQELYDNYGLGVYALIRSSYDQSELSASDLAQSYYESVIMSDSAVPPANVSLSDLLFPDKEKGLVSLLDLKYNEIIFLPYGYGDLVFEPQDLEPVRDSMIESFNNREYDEMYRNFALSVTTLAKDFFDYAGKSRLIDDADLFTPSEERALAAHAAALKSKYSFDIVLHTTESTGSRSLTAYADDYYDYNGYGVGPGYDGLLFMLDMDTRAYRTSTCGYGLTAFTDYGISLLGDEIESTLSSGMYYQAFEDYLDLCDEILEQAATGKPYDTNNTYRSASDIALGELIALAVAAIIAFLVGAWQKGKLNSAIKNRTAANYVKADSFNLREQKDIYLFSTVTKTRRETSSGGGGSSSHSSSSGRSHGGGGGHF